MSYALISLTLKKEYSWYNLFIYWDYLQLNNKDLHIICNIKNSNNKFTRNKK